LLTGQDVDEKGPKQGLVWSWILKSDIETIFIIAVTLKGF
jgi:hypothetical protein